MVYTSIPKNSPFEIVRSHHPGGHQFTLLSLNHRWTDSNLWRSTPQPPAREHFFVHEPRPHRSRSIWYNITIHNLQMVRGKDHGGLAMPGELPKTIVWGAWIQPFWSCLSYHLRHKNHNLVWLVGGFHLPLWKIWKSIGMMTVPIYGKIEHVPHHQPVYDNCHSAEPHQHQQTSPSPGLRPGPTGCPETVQLWPSSIFFRRRPIDVPRLGSRYFVVAGDCLWFFLTVNWDL